MQNAVDHGFPEGSAGGKVVVSSTTTSERLRVQVIDDGAGLEPGFDLDTATGLGLSIVRTLVTTELERPDLDASGDGGRPRSRRSRRRTAPITAPSSSSTCRSKTT